MSILNLKLIWKEIVALRYVRKDFYQEQSYFTGLSQCDLCIYVL
jgi:hypothetical protein